MNKQHVKGATIRTTEKQTWNWVTFCDPATQWPVNPATRRPNRLGDPVL